MCFTIVRTRVLCGSRLASGIQVSLAGAHGCFFVSDRESKAEEGERESKEGEAAAGVATASAALPPVSISQLLEYVPSEALVFRGMGQRLVDVDPFAVSCRSTVLRGGLVEGGDAGILRAAITGPPSEVVGVDANTQFLLDLLDSRGQAAILHAVRILALSCLSAATLPHGCTAPDYFPLTPFLSPSSAF